MGNLVSRLLLPLTLLASCQEPTAVRLTLSGIGLGGSTPAASIRIQFFDPDQGEFFDELVLNSNDVNGVQDGETVTIQINPPQESFDVEIAVGAFSLTNELLGAGRSAPINITFAQTSVSDIDLFKPSCGDGFFDVETEICDDAGNAEGCPDLCQDDLCGDALVNNLLEECDLGESRNGSIGEGCNERCELDASLVFGGRLSLAENAPSSTTLLREGINQSPNLASLGLNGAVEIFPLTGDRTTPLGASLASLQTTQQVSAVATADLSQDGLPELLLLDTLASELHVFANLDGTIAGQPSAILALQDPNTGQNVSVSDLAVLSQDGSPEVLVMVAQDELWLLSPSVDGSLDLANLSRVALANPGAAVLLADLDGDEAPEISVSEGAEVEVFTAAGVLLRSFSCGGDGVAASLVDLDLVPLASPALLSTRSDGRLCLFQLGTPDQELTFFASANAASSVVLRGGDQLDIIVGQGDSPIGALFSLASFEAPATIETVALSGGTGRLSGFDLDGDQLDDLISTSVPASAIAMFLRAEGGALHLPRAVPAVGALQAMTPVDLNNNNITDIAALSPSQVLVFSDIEDPSAPQLLPGVSAPNNVRVIDQNFDTFPDLAVPNRDDHSITVLRGDGQGAIADTVVLTLGAPFGPLDLVVGNIDNLLGLDWAVLYDDTSTPALNDGDLLLYFNVTGDTLPDPVEFDFEAQGLHRLESKDLNQDFFRDLVLSSAQSNRADWLTIGSLEPESTTIEPAEGCSPVASIPAELSEDGDTDLALFCGESGAVFFQDSPSVLPAPDLVELPFAAGQLRTATVGDLNGDGHLDLVAASPEGSVTLALGKGDGTFTAPFTMPGSQAVSSMLVLSTSSTQNLFMSDDVAGLLVRWIITP